MRADGPMGGMQKGRSASVPGTCLRGGGGGGAPLRTTQGWAWARLEAGGGGGPMGRGVTVYGDIKGACTQQHPVTAFPMQPAVGRGFQQDAQP